ncbi:auxin efflux carrier [bacterium LRH843]|nr:auxin efflux carrier [bacterium LRH843]
MDITSVFTSIGMMGIVVCFGVLIGRKLEITQEAKQLLMMIIVNVAVPAIILNGVFNTDITDALLGNMIAIFFISIALNLTALGLCLGFAYLLGFRSIEAKKFAILAGLGNSGFIGIPLCAQLFGPIGGLLAAIFDAGLDVVVFSIVIMMLQHGKGFSIRNFKALINIPFCAIIIGLTIAMVGFEPPTIAKNLASFLSSTAAPLAMIYIGLLIPDFFRKRKKIPLKFLSNALVMKLLIFPLIMIAIFHSLPLTVLIKEVLFVLVAMPTVMLAPVLLSRYANDEDTGVMTTVYSTLFSLLTIPIILYIASFLL